LWDENKDPYITTPPELIDDISALPRPDWDAICFDDYYGSLSMNFINAHRRYTSVYTSRGCPFSCAYCHHTQGKKVRYRNIRHVVDEIEYIYHKHGIREIQIVDDIFNINKERVFEFCRLIKERNIKIYISFPNGLRGDVLTEAVIDALVDAGAYSMTFAIESASPRIQKLIKKNLNLEKAKDMIRYAYGKGVITRCFFMIGFVTETEKEVKQTVDLALELPLLHAAFFTVAPQKNTELFEITKKLDPEFNVEKGSHYFGNLPSYIDYDLPAIQRRAYMRFFFSPVRMFHYFWRLPRKLQFIRMMLIAGRDVVFRMK